MTTKQKLSLIFKAGIEAARLSDPGPASDGGTCNLDSVKLSLPRIRASTVLSAAELSNTHATSFTSFGTRMWWIGVGAMGQGFRRTKMVEAGARAMQLKINELGMASEWFASVYYQMD